MKFFIDTANIEEITKANELGMVDGVTTNPSLVSKEGREFTGLIKEICGIVDGPVSAEVVSVDTEGMVREAKDLAKLAGNIVIKIPLIEAGLKAVKILTSEGIKTNVTLCFSPVQALLAAKAGAAYISPFVEGWTTSATRAWNWWNRFWLSMRIMALRQRPLWQASEIPSMCLNLH